MTRDPRVDYPRLPLDYVDAISPHQCIHYLETHGWKESATTDGGDTLVYRHPRFPEADICVLLTREFADYPNRVADAITTAAAQEGRPFWEVYMDMAGRYYVGPNTYAPAATLNGSLNGTAKHAESSPVASAPIT